MRNLKHDTGSVAVFAYLRTTVAHVLQHAERIVNQLMTFVAVNIHNHTHATGVMFIHGLVQTLF